MRTLYSLEDLDTIRQPVHLAMGVFDGVHLGHKAVIARAVENAHSQGELAGVLTFDRHPLEVVDPKNAPKRLLANFRHKEKLLAELGVDVMIALRFTRELADLSAEEFLHRLTNGVDLRSISVGNDWRFGKARSGSIDFLNEEAEKRGFSVHITLPIVDGLGNRISSTAIRQSVSEGRLAEAREMLGRDYTLIGKVIHGRQLAGKWGYPTANVDIYNEQLPPIGVYWAKAILLDGKELYGVANLGTRPTVETKQTPVSLEIHLWDWSGDLYGQELEVAFIEYLREEKKFDGIEELKKQIAMDDAKARGLMVQFCS